MGSSLLDAERAVVAAKPRCLNCGAELTGPFCAVCGQQEIDLAAPTIDVIRESVSDALDVDGRLLRTARALIRPGLLTSEYQGGRRIPYIGPLKLFLIAGALLSTTWVVTRGIDAHFYGYPVTSNSQGYIEAVVRGLLAGSLAMASGSWVLMLGRRRMVDETVFALHTTAALSLMLAAAIWLGTVFKIVFGSVASVPSWIPPLPRLVFLPAALLAAAYFVACVRRVHGGPWWRTAMESLVLAALCAASITFAIRFLA